MNLFNLSEQLRSHFLRLIYLAVNLQNKANRSRIEIGIENVIAPC